MDCKKENKMKILLAEDEVNMRIVQSELLKKYGEVDIACNGLEAVALAAHYVHKEYYDLICLDIQMPELDGLKALEEIREIEKNAGIKEAIIIMMTASEENTDILNSFHSKCDSYLIKPINKLKIENELNNIGITR